MTTSVYISRTIFCETAITKRSLDENMIKYLKAEGISLLLFCLPAHGFAPPAAPHCRTGTTAVSRLSRPAPPSLRRAAPLRGGAVMRATGTAPAYLPAAYTAASLMTTLSWTAMAVTSLNVHPTWVLPLRHNVLTIAQALAFPLPVAFATFAALSDAGEAGEAQQDDQL